MAKLPSYGRGSAFDHAVAGFAAASLGFAAFAMPEWRLTQLVMATGLPDFLSAAQPPLGMKARIGFALLAALFSFGGFFALLRAADRRPAPRRAEPEPAAADEAPEPIRLRRADMHPDAPARRPLVAARDLGEPEASEPLLEAEPPAERNPLPSFLVAQPPEEEDVAQMEPEDDVLDLVAEALPEAEPAPARATESHTGLATEAAPEPAPEGEESITKLMKRLEFGLAKRERSPALDAASVAPRSADAVGHRLRSAISDLEKLAARG